MVCLSNEMIFSDNFFVISGVQIPLGQLIENKNFGGGWSGLNYNEYIVYDESQVALRYLVQFRN
jgi:hypothetical protein